MHPYEHTDPDTTALPVLDRADVVTAVREGDAAQAEAAAVLAQPTVRVSPLVLAAEGYPVPTEAEIIALFDHGAVALHNGDVDELAGMFAQDATLVGAFSGAPCLDDLTRRAYLGLVTGMGLWASVLDRRVYRGYGIAVDTGRVALTVAATGEDRPMRYTVTYVWEGDAWRVTCVHCSADLRA